MKSNSTAFLIKIKLRHSLGRPSRSDFVQSYLVNKNYVKEFTYEWVKMLNGDVLNISKINRADVRRKILESAADEFKNV